MSGIYNGLALDCLDVEGRLDWMDGWHEESGLGFKTKRDPEATRLHLETHLAPTACMECRRIGNRTQCHHHEVTAAACMKAGRMERREVREARGL